MFRVDMENREPVKKRQSASQKEKHVEEAILNAVMNLPVKTERAKKKMHRYHRHLLLHVNIGLIRASVNYLAQELGIFQQNLHSLLKPFSGYYLVHLGELPHFSSSVQAIEY